MLWIVALALVCLSPRGASNANAADDSTAIFVMKVDGSELRRVAEIKGYSQLNAPRWSHDAGQLAFDGLSEDGKDQRIYLTEVESGIVRPFGAGSDADWSPDDTQLVFDGGDPTAMGQGIWVQNADGRGRLALSDVGRAPRWSPQGGEIAALHDEAIQIFNLVDSTRRTLDGVAGVLAGFDWSPDGNRLAYVARQGDELALWVVDAADSAKKQKLLAGELDGHLAWSPDGERLAISLGGRIHLVSSTVSAEDAAKPQAIPDQEGLNRMPAWSSDGESLAFASSRATPALAGSIPTDVPREIRSVRLEEVRRHTRGAVVYGLDLTLKRDLEVWDLNTGESGIVNLRGEWVTMSPDGNTVAQSGPLVKIALGDLKTEKPIRDLFVGTMCTNTKFSFDGKRLATGTVDGKAIVFDTMTGKRICTFENHNAPITRVAFLPDGKEVVSNGQDEFTRIWNAETGEERAAIKHPEVAWGLAVSPDGRLIATGTGGHTFDAPILHKMLEPKETVIRIWDSKAGKLLREMPGHTDMIYSLIFSPDGRTLISGSWDTTIRLWDVASGKELTSVAGQGSIYALAITPDGKHIVAGGGENRSAGKPLRRYRDEQVRLFRIVEE
jgi:WD40 repeat protein